MQPNEPGFSKQFLPTIRTILEDSVGVEGTGGATPPPLWITDIVVESETPIVPLATQAEVPATWYATAKDTVATTEKEPEVQNWWLVSAPSAAVPSPKFQAVEIG